MQNQVNQHKPKKAQEALQAKPEGLQAQSRAPHSRTDVTKAASSNVHHESKATPRLCIRVPPSTTPQNTASPRSSTKPKMMHHSFCRWQEPTGGILSQVNFSRRHPPPPPPPRTPQPQSWRIGTPAVFCCDSKAGSPGLQMGPEETHRELPHGFRHLEGREGQGSAGLRAALGHEAASKRRRPPGEKHPAQEPRRERRKPGGGANGAITNEPQQPQRPPFLPPPPFPL